MAPKTALLLSTALALLILLSAGGDTASAASPKSKKNVLLLFIDDGGFQMGAYGSKAVKTPNIDSFAKRSVVFKHGYTSVSSCSPSRSCLLTGKFAVSARTCALLRMCRRPKGISMLFFV